VTARHRERFLVDRLVRELTVGRHPGLLLVLWRWRWELALLLAAGAVAWWTSPVHLVLGLAGLAALYSAVPAVRCFLDGRFWSVVTQHRLRVGFRESDLRSWSGRRPAILWASAQPHGQRVVISCPAGVDVARIQAVRSELATACWAADVRVARHPKHANLVVVLVVRTPPPERGGDR
jgi:hypothetical protein